MSDPTTTSAMLHGPGGMLATPGLGGARKRKWGKRDKACTCGIATKAGEPGEHIAPGVTRIRGNLCNVHGKYGPCDAGATAKPKKGRARKPKAAPKPKQTPEQRAAARDTQHQANVDSAAKRMADSDTGLSPSGVQALTAFATGQQPDEVQGPGLAKMGLAEQASDGSYRMTPTGHAVVAAMQAGDYQRAIDAISRGTDASGKRTERQRARAQRQQAAADRKQQAQARRDAVQARRSSTRKPKDTPAAETAQAVSRASAAPKRSAMPHAGARVTPPKGDASAKPAKVAPAPKQITLALIDAAAKLSDGSVTDAQLQTLIRNGLAKLNKDGTPVLTAAGLRATEKSFTVFKDHTGAHRWIARTTTAYEDRDKEILSSGALDQDSQRMTTTKQFGPLRWWHVGDPDPFATDMPWGPGLDLGTCDYSVLIGHTRVESGTFYDPVIAEKVARAADRLEMSPGFFHPLDQPQGGVFSTMRTFERSLVPTRYGRASNLFTGFTVKEFSMHADEMERRFKAAITDLGLDGAQAQSLSAQLIATEKTAQAQGIAFKSEAQPIADEITINGVVYKAFPPAKAEPAADAGMTSVEEKAPPVDDTTVDVMADPAEPMDAPDEGNYIGDMDVDAFKAMLSELLAPVLRLQDMVKSIGDMHGEMKSMMGGTATKEAGNTAEIAALKARIAEIEGRQPATILPTDVEAALKSAGPSEPDQPARPDIVDVVNDPDRPWAGWGARTFPELYGLPKTQ